MGPRFRGDDVYYVAVTRRAERLQDAVGPSRKPAMRMGRALQNWLDSHGLGAIIAAVLGIIVLLAVILVVGGYWYVTR